MYLYTFLFWDGSDMYFYAQALAADDVSAEEMVRAAYTRDSGRIFIGLSGFHKLDKEGVIVDALACFGESELTEGELQMVKNAQEAEPDSNGEEDLFVTRGDMLISCMSCLTPEERVCVDSDDDNYRVWEDGSDGWMEPPACERCGKVFDVVVDGQEGKKK